MSSESESNVEYPSLDTVIYGEAATKGDQVEVNANKQNLKSKFLDGPDGIY